MAPGHPGLNSPRAHAPAEGGSHTARENVATPGVHVLTDYCVCWWISACLYTHTNEVFISHIGINKAAYVVNCRPAFGGRECKGEGIEAELCHRQVRFHWSCLH